VIRQQIVRCFLVSLCLAAGLGLPLKGQEARIDYSHLDRLAEKAEDVVDITLDESLLRLASSFLSADKDEAAIKNLVHGLKGIFVRSYKFNQPGGYSEQDLRVIRDQTSKPGWKRLVGIRTKRQSAADLEIYVMHDDRTVRGVAVLAAGPRELTVVNIVGPIDIAKLRELEGQLGIPELGLSDGESKAGAQKDKEKDE